MQLLIFSNDIYKSPAYGAFVAGLPYVVPNASYRDILRSRIDSGLNLIADVQPFDTDRNWSGKHEPKSLLVYNSGLIGDTLWVTALVRRIKQLYPDTSIDVVSNHGNIFQGSRDVRAVKYEPLLAETANGYDEILFLDEVIYSHKERNQKNCYELLFDASGVPYDESVAIPQLQLSFGDEQRLWYLIGEVGEDGSRTRHQNHIVLGLHASKKLRTPEKQLYIDLVEKLFDQARSQMSEENFLNYRIYGVSTDGSAWPLQEELTQRFHPIYTPLHNRLGIRELAALMRTAYAVVAPDSLLIHLAASQSTPCVALMSTIAPECRISTYPLCVACWRPDACSYAPCFGKQESHTFDGVEVEILPCHTSQRTNCDCVKIITAKDIIHGLAIVTARKRALNIQPKPLPLA